MVRPRPARPAPAVDADRRGRRAGVQLATVGLAAGLLILAATALAALGGVVVSGAAIGPSLRLRVVAASNAPADQRVKLAVRDAMLAVVAPGLEHATSASAATAQVRRRLGRVRAVAEEVAARFGQRAQVHLGTAAFPAERLGWLLFPAGRYPALVVRLGAARGHNWWTVLFPPLALLTVDGRLVVVGPGVEGPWDTRAAGALTASERAALLAALAGRVRVRGAGGGEGARVLARFALWDLGRDVGRAVTAVAPRRLLAWIAGTTA